MNNATSMETDGVSPCRNRPCSVLSMSYQVEVVAGVVAGVVDDDDVPMAFWNACIISD